jgi:hypothetical protein
MVYLLRSPGEIRAEFPTLICWVAISTGFAASLIAPSNEHNVDIG